MGCVPSKDKSNAKRSPEAGYFAVSYTFHDKSPEEETAELPTQKEIKEPEPESQPVSSSKTTSPSVKQRLGKPLFGGGLSAGFGKFETMFTEKVKEEKHVIKKPKPVSRRVDMTLVYQVPRSKLNINPHDDDTKGYLVHDCRVTGLEDTEENTRQLMNYFHISPP